MDPPKFIDPHYLILEFLEVAIHSVLHARKLYPDGIFTMKKKYGVPIYVSMYPDLNYYISESLLAIKEVFLKNELKQVDIYFYNRLAKPIERFIFKINVLEKNIRELESSEPYLVRLKELFRSFCLKLNINNSYMKSLPEDANFKIVVHTTECASISLSEDSQFQKFPWIEAEKVDIVIDNAKLIPLRTIEHELLNIHIFCEESENK